MIFTLSPESERNFETLIDMINLSECREEDETFKNAVDVQFECVEAWLNGEKASRFLERDPLELEAELV